MTAAKVVFRRLAVVWARVQRDEQGSEFVQFAIVLLIVGVMGSGLLFAVNAFWPDAVASVLRRIGDLVFS